MAQLSRPWIVLIFFLTVFQGAAYEDETMAPAEGPEDVPNLGGYPESAVEATTDQKMNHPPQIFVTAEPGWRIVEGTTTVSSPWNQKVSAVIVAHGSDEDGDPLEYMFINDKTGRVVGPGPEDWVVVSPYETPGSYPGKVIVKDTVSGQTAEANFEVVVVAADEDKTTSTDINDKSVAKRDIIRESPDEEDEMTPSSSGSDEKNWDLLNCLCRCVKPERSDFDCRYNLTPYPMVLGGSPSCGDLKNGPCMCQAIGCFRAPLPTSGDCYNACRNQYPGASVIEPIKGGNSDTIDETEPEPELDSPGDLVPAVSLGFNPETEPNDQIGDANEIRFASPVGMQGEITPAGDVDFFKFYVDSAGVLEVKMDQVPDDMKTRIDLYGKNFNWMTRKDASNPADQIALLADLPGPGQGFIAISDLDLKAHSSGYSFIADFLPAKDNDEPNDRAGDSTEIGLDQKVSAYICPIGDVDFYKFYVDSAGIMEIRLDTAPNDMKIRIDLYDKNFDWVARKDASNSGDVLNWDVDIPGPSVHYLAISDLDRKAHADPYSFKATFRAAPDANEPNDQVGDSTDMALGQTVIGYICPIDDVDFYKIQVDGPTMLEIKLENVPSDMRSRIDLYGKNFNWITRNDASNAGDVITLQSDLAGPGAYYIAVSDLDRKAHDQEYQLTIA